MVIKSLKLTNFRNYTEQEVEFGNGVNIICGRNAQGKTNLIEPIYILSTQKSFRNSKLSDCIMEEKSKAIIEAEIVSEIYGERKIKYVINRDSENEFYLNENKLNSKNEIYGSVYSVIFSPDELRLVKGSPDVRREFLDIDISQVSRVYIDLLERYEEILANRNKLLKNHRFINGVDRQLDVWDYQLAVVGSQISITRKHFIDRLNKSVSRAMEYISGGKESLRLVYQGIKGGTREEKTDSLIYALMENRERDKELGYTTIGPHRDDIKFFVNEKEVKYFASQGQQRSVVLALKLAELETINEEKECPILLLDDVFSELDYNRQLLLVKYLKNTQIFITSTIAKTKGIENIKKFKVDEGRVKKQKV